MKISRFLAIAGLVAAGTAAAHDGGNSSILFKFNGGTGNQVFRSAAGVPTLNTVAGVNPAGAPWGLASFDAIIKTNGDIRGNGEGVVLLGADGIGSRAGPRQLILSLFCRNAPVPPAVAAEVLLGSLEIASTVGPH